MNKVCVIGSGVMGSAIAAQIANSCTNVILLDIADSASTSPSTIAEQAVNRMLLATNSPLSHPKLIKYIKTGNLKDDLNLISECDLVIEAIVEKLEAKHKLYDMLIPYLKDKAFIASNTSTIPLTKLKEKLPKKLQNYFIITHFFNPPRYMELVEIVSDDKCNQRYIGKVLNFISRKLGKTVIKCNDTPGFIANRIGCFLLEMSVRKAINLKLDPLIVDQIFTKLFGFPSTGVFGLYDLIGHDVMDLISKSLIASLPVSDAYHNACTHNKILSEMKNKGLLGRKSGAGFYKIVNKDGEKLKQVLDFNSLEYTKVISQYTINSIEELLSSNDQYGKYFSEILLQFFSYVLTLIPHVSSSTEDIDKAMRLGYSLKYGPFELLNKMPNGKNWLPKNLADHCPIFHSTNNRLLKDHYTTLLTNDSAELVKYNNHHIFIIKTKMSVLNENVFNLLIDSVNLSEDRSTNLIIYPGSGKNFSVGADIKIFYDKIINKEFAYISNFIDLGQKAMLKIKYSDISVISCAQGLALGGGCELLLHSNYVIAHQNLKAGLVELGVGLIPGWGGVKEMFLRSDGEEEKLIQNIGNIIYQYKSDSCDYFSEKYNIDCYLNMNSEYLIEDAIKFKARAISNDAIVKNEKWHKTSVTLPQIDLGKKFKITELNDLQQNVLSFFQGIIDIGSISENELLNLEKQKFLELCQKNWCIQNLLKFFK